MERERLLDASSRDPGAVCASWDLGLIVSLMRRIGVQGRQSCHFTRILNKVDLFRIQLKPARNPGANQDLRQTSAVVVSQIEMMLRMVFPLELVRLQQPLQIAKSLRYWKMQQPLRAVHPLPLLPSWRSPLPQQLSAQC